MSLAGEALMELYPAIDLLDGHCVRLYQGDYDRASVYGDDPVAQAVAFADAGAGWIHVVDLDAARTGIPANRETVAAVAGALRGRGVLVQSGGGVRDDLAAAALLDAGVARVVLGTAALEDPGLVSRLVAEHPDRVAVGLDARGRELAVRGWQEASGQDLVERARAFDQAGVAALVVTEIGRDGTLTGPDLEGLAAVLDATGLDVIASGGVGSVDDLERLAALRSGGGRRLAGAIVGRALYEGAFTIGEALAAARSA